MLGCRWGGSVDKGDCWIEPTGSYRQTHLFDQQAYMHATRLCFEIAVFQAVQTVLGVLPRSCLFHFTQNIIIPTYTESRASGGLQYKHSTRG